MKFNSTLWLALLLLVITQQSYAEPVNNGLLNSSVMLVGFKLEGDTSLKSYWQKDKQLTDQFDVYLAEQLSQQLNAKVVSAATGNNLLKTAEHDADLHHCNGCEVDIAKQLGADFVLMPRVFRMSILIQTLFVDVRDANTGKLIIHKGRNFRGNTEEGWQHAIDNLLRDLAP